MQTYDIYVEGRAIRANSADTTLVRTSSGIDRIHVLFDSEEWLSFPVKITFAHDSDRVSADLPLSRISNSDWVAEGSCVIPREVIRRVGPIRITLQGTDSNGNHIITAKASPLSVEEAGDVDLGNEPDDAPTVSQWQQAYSDAIAAVAQARSLVENLESSLADMVADARAEIGASVSPATRESLGQVMVGDGLTITEEGVLSTVLTNGITVAQASQLINLASLAYYGFDVEFDDDGLIRENVKAKPSLLPIAGNDTPGAVYPDGTTITMDDDGMLHGDYFRHSWDGTVLTIRSLSGESSADLGYTLTEQDKQDIAAIVAQMMSE